MEELGPLLTDIAVGKRKTGLSFLSRLLTELKPHCLNQVQDLIYSVLTEGQSFLSEAPFGGNWQGEMGPNETLARKFLTLVLPTTPSKEKLSLFLLARVLPKEKPLPEVLRYSPLVLIKALLRHIR